MGIIAGSELVKRSARQFGREIEDNVCQCKSVKSVSKKNIRKLKAIDLFAGIGGMALGMQQAGIDVIGLVEMNEMCISTLAANRKRAFPRAEIIQGDLSAMSGRDIMSRTRIRKGELDILSGGPPCQGFTWANKNRSIHDPRSQLMWHFIRLVGEIKPRYFVIENVPGLLSFKDFFVTLLAALEKKRYTVRFNLLDAASYGVPQRRIRVFIEGLRNDLKGMPVFPPPTHFDLDNDKAFPPVSLMAIECFVKNGFSKEQVFDVWWNRKLDILMAKSTAAETVEQAARQIIFKGLLGHAKKYG